jgi:polysaccharide deacetylase 2 family uncharacterized protein YibQ
MSARRRRSASGRRRAWVPLVLAGGLLFAAGLYFGARRRPEATPEPPATARAAPRPVRKPAPAAPRARKPAPPPAAVTAPLPAGPLPPAVGRPRVALVVDDLGRSLADLDTLAALEVPIAYAVLPFESMTGPVAAELGRRGVEVLCHLPMEATNGADPGPGALRLGMTGAELAERTRAALDAVPGAVGVNNHMGSGLSADAAAMRAILAVVAERGLYYLDSRTSPESLGYRAALQAGIPAAERHVFLDAAPGAAAVEGQFRRLLEVASERGAAVGIAHPHPYTLEVLRREVPEARRLGYEFVPASYLLDHPAGPPE